MTRIIPFQTKTVVILEYLAVGVAHAVQGVRYWARGDKARAMFHFTTALSAVCYPIWYQMDRHTEFRLHHSMMGLLLQLAPTQSLRVLGTAINADSALYSIERFRGNRDIMNMIFNDFPFVVQSVVYVSLLEKVLKYFSQPIQETNVCNELSLPSSHFGENVPAQPCQ